MVLAARHLTQGSLDGVTAAIRVGPVTELDLMWRFAMADDRPGVVELVADAGRGERRDRRPGCGRVMPWVVPRPAELLDRDLVTELAATGARTALLQVLERVT